MIETETMIMSKEIKLISILKSSYIIVRDIKTMLEETIKFLHTKGD